MTEYKFLLVEGTEANSIVNTLADEGWVLHSCTPFVIPGPTHIIMLAVSMEKVGSVSVIPSISPPVVVQSVDYPRPNQSSVTGPVVHRMGPEQPGIVNAGNPQQEMVLPPGCKSAVEPIHGARLTVEAVEFAKQNFLMNHPGARIIKSKATDGALYIYYLPT